MAGEGLHRSFTMGRASYERHRAYVRSTPGSRPRAAVRELLAGQCLRSLGFSRTSVQRYLSREGLRTLSDESLADRHKTAYLVGVISAGNAEVLARARVFAVGEQQNRESRVCLFYPGGFSGAIRIVASHLLRLGVG